MIDVDWLCQNDPAPADDHFNNRLAFANLAAVWPNYAGTGIEYLVLARVVRTSGLEDLVVINESQPTTDLTAEILDGLDWWSAKPPPVPAGTISAMASTEARPTRAVG